MRKLGLALLFLLGSVGLAQAQPPADVRIPCNHNTANGTLTAGTTQLVAGVAGQIFVVCGYVIEGLAAGSVQIVVGTGATCTTPTAITPIFTVTATTSIVDHVDYGYFSSAAGQTLCAVVTGTNSVTPTVYYAQY